MANTLWDDVETVLDRQPGPSEREKSSSFSNGYFRDLAHAALFEAPATDGDLALDRMQTQAAFEILEPAVPRAFPARHRAARPNLAGPRPMTAQAARTTFTAPVIPLPGVVATDPGSQPDPAPQPQPGRGTELQPPARGRLPLLKLNERPEPAPPRQNVRCYMHGHLGTKVCINCETPLCPDCKYLLINDRPWCMQCGRPYKPGLLSALLLTLKVVFKAAVFVGAMAGTIFFAPVPLAARAVIAVCLGLVLAWILFLNDDVDFEVKVVKGT